MHRDLLAPDLIVDPDDPKRVLEPVIRWLSTACLPLTKARSRYPGAGKSAGGFSYRPWRYFTTLERAPDTSA